jgi:LPS sulfotransferase NodH
MLQNVHVPTTSYLVCASQRSGTTLLCRALADTGIADWPDEYFLAVDDEELPGWHCWEDGPSAHRTASGSCRTKNRSGRGHRRNTASI